MLNYSLSMLWSSGAASRPCLLYDDSFHQWHNGVLKEKKGNISKSPNKLGLVLVYTKHDTIHNLIICVYCMCNSLSNDIINAEPILYVLIQFSWGPVFSFMTKLCWTEKEFSMVKRQECINNCESCELNLFNNNVLCGDYRNLILKLIDCRLNFTNKILYEVWRIDKRKAFFPTGNLLVIFTL